MTIHAEKKLHCAYYFKIFNPKAKNKVEKYHANEKATAKEMKSSRRLSANGQEDGESRFELHQCLCTCALL